MYNKRFDVISTSNIEPEAVEIRGDKVYVRTNIRLVQFRPVDDPNGNLVSYYSYDETEQLVFDYIKTISKIEPLTERTLTAAETYENLLANSDEYRDISLSDFKTLRINKLKEECSDAIYSGFVSDTTDYTFGFNELDQVNFSQQAILLVLNSGNLTPVEWKTQDSGVVSLQREQFVTVLNETEEHKRINQTKYWTLEAQILAATDKQAVREIEW